MSDQIPIPEPLPEVTEDTARIGREIRKTLRLLVIATVVLFCVQIGVVVYVYLSSQDNTHALCAFRQEAQSRVEQSTKFLAKNPQGAFGFSAAQIQKGILDAQSTVDALNGLNC